MIEHGRGGRQFLYNEKHPEGEVVMETLPGNVASYGFELRDFSQAVLHGTALQASPEYSLGELRTALVIYRSVESRRWEKVWSCSFAFSSIHRCLPANKTA